MKRPFECHKEACSPLLWVRASQFNLLHLALGEHTRLAEFCALFFARIPVKTRFGSVPSITQCHCCHLSAAYSAEI